MELHAQLPDEYPAVRALLADAGLPVEDLDDADVHFILATDDSGPVGAIGLEAFGDVGLLRSLVVCSRLRGAGIGGRLVEALEAHALGAGFAQLVLLTQTAEPFFAMRGYRAIDRAQAPAAVQASAEFRSLCPASAACMIKTLG